MVFQYTTHPLSIPPFLQVYHPLRPEMYLVLTVTQCGITVHFLISAQNKNTRQQLQWLSKVNEDVINTLIANKDAKETKCLSIEGWYTGYKDIQYTACSVCMITYFSYHLHSWHFSLVL